MTTTTAAPAAPLDLRAEAKALAGSVVLTFGFTALYVLLAPVVLLGALFGGPLWAVVVLARGDR